VASLAGDIEVEEAADYLYQNGIVAYAYRRDSGRGAGGESSGQGAQAS